MELGLSIGLGVAFVVIVVLLFIVVWYASQKKHAEVDKGRLYDKIFEKDSRINELSAAENITRGGLTLSGWAQRCAYLEDEVESMKYQNLLYSSQVNNLEEILKEKEEDLYELKVKLEKHTRGIEVIGQKTALAGVVG